MRLFNTTALFLACLLVMPACVRQPTATTQPHKGTPEQSIKAIVTGIDTFDGGHVMSLNTAHGMFVIGPQVSYTDKQRVHETLLAAHDRVITIRYIDKPRTDTTIEHRLVTGLEINETTFRFPQ